jgi:hypothetical protein
MHGVAQVFFAMHESRLTSLEIQKSMKCSNSKGSSENDWRSIQLPALYVQKMHDAKVAIEHRKTSTHTGTHGSLSFLKTKL